MKKQHMLQERVYGVGMDEPLVPTFGEWLREKLSQRDRSASWLARHLGVTPQTVASYLAGNARPGREKIPAIAEALAISEDLVWDAWRETPGHPHSDVTLARLLDLPDDLRRDEVVLLRNIFRAIRETEREIEANDRPDSRQG